MKKVLKKIKYIKLKYIMGIIPFLIVLLPSLIYKVYLKIINKRIWLICEQHHTARDNGYYFYKYMCTNHKKINTYYAIDYDSKDYKRVNALGKTVKFGSLKHYFLYLACEYNISSHKDGNPNELIFTICHLYLNLFNNRIFLDHGVIKDDIEMFYQENTKFKMFTCAAKTEYEYVKKNYHYKNNEVVYTGLARFDGLYDFKVLSNQIVVIPTWRNWLGRETNSFSKNNNFYESGFYKNWNSFLNNEKLINYIESNNINIVFYPHIMMQKYLGNFKTKSKNIKIINVNEKNIQELMKESAMLITDYSSVYFDFAYMEKPLMYYQFDYKEYRENHLKEGYFSYEKNGFGEVVYNEDDLIDGIISYIDNEFKVKIKFKNRMNEFFTKKDKNNCKRIYEEIINLKK